MDSEEGVPNTPGHKRSRSAALKALVNPRSRTQSPTKSALKSQPNGQDVYRANYNNGAPRSPQKPIAPRDKENVTPPTSVRADGHAPIWAQFASQQSTPQSPGKQSPNKPDFWMNSTLDNRQQNSPTRPSRTPQRESRVMATVAMFERTPKADPAVSKELDTAFEAVLASRNIPEKMRQQMRALDPKVKSDFVRHQGSVSQEPDRPEEKVNTLWNTLRGRGSSRGRSNADSKRDSSEDRSSAHPASAKRSRSRGRALPFSKNDGSPSKRARSNSRPRSLMSLKNLSSTSLSSIGSNKSSKGDNRKDSRSNQMLPEDFVDYLDQKTRPEDVEIGKIHKLRLLLRNEDVSWVDDFITFDGFKKLLDLLRRITQLEWREEHEDILLHEVLLCLKGLSTTEKGLQALANNEAAFFTDMFTMLFDEERKGPSEYNTRETIIQVAFAYLSNTAGSQTKARAQKLLSYLADPGSSEEDKPVDFIAQMKQRRPYQKWHKEVSDVTREVFWIFLHHLNVVPVQSIQDCSDADFKARNFPKERPPVPAAPYVGGVEWDATNYVAAHLDLMNGLIASLPLKSERNALREELRASGFEKLMGWTLRLCKEKFYCCVHDGLRTWVAAAIEDDWDVSVVRMGPTKEEMNAKSPKKGGSPQKETAPAPKLELNVGSGLNRGGDGWL